MGKGVKSADYIYVFRARSLRDIKLHILSYLYLYIKIEQVLETTENIYAFRARYLKIYSVTKQKKLSNNQHFKVLEIE